MPLIPGGQHVPVTGANVGRYVARLCEWTLGEAVEAQFRAFATGFHQVRVCKWRGRGQRWHVMPGWVLNRPGVREA